MPEKEVVIPEIRKLDKKMSIRQRAELLCSCDDVFLKEIMASNELVEEEVFGELCESFRQITHRDYQDKNILIIRCSEVLIQKDPPFEDPEFVNLGLLCERMGYKEFSFYGNLKNNIKDVILPLLRDGRGFLAKPFYGRIEKGTTKAGNETYYLTNPVREDPR